jgi:hypothetical protein
MWQVKEWFVGNYKNSPSQKSPGADNWLDDWSLFGEYQQKLGLNRKILV